MKKYYYLFNIFLLFQLGCADNFPYPDSVLPDFNICDQWRDGMTWQDFQTIRTNLERRPLIRYVDKIQANRMLKDKNVPVIPVIFASHTKEPFLDKIKDLKTFVAKPSHMSQNNGLIIYDDGFDLHAKKPITLEEVQKRMHDLIDTKTNSNEWILRNIEPGFLIQEYIKGRQEIKIQTIWGKPIEMVWVQGGTTMIENFYDVDGEPLRGSKPWPFSKQLLEEAKKIAERVAAGTDALRVDIIVRFNDDGTKDLLVNELELRSAIDFVQQKKFAQLLNNGYRRICK